MIDQEIIYKIKSGDVSAFESAFKTYAKPLHAYGYTLLANNHQAEEMIQQLFLKIWEQRATLEIHTSLKAYLYRSIHNDCMNHIRHQKVKRDYQLSVVKEAASTHQEPVSRLEVKEIQQRLRSGMAKLPEACRTIFQLSRFEHLSYKEIASQLGISIKTVENQMGKALRILRVELKDYLVTLLTILLITNCFN
ncbi:MAG TPA: RNA polymerase sigma-70 factor [Arachidicoccus sp.]|nr:RNA polymerase sigma-70 factor [Arachidicoccus sp.]